MIPVYNSEAFVFECLSSVLVAIPHNCEVIVVDDGSTDHSLRVIETHFAVQISSGVLTVLKISNVGPGQARNIGVNSARGKYICFLDSDDRLLSGFFEAIVEAISQFSPDIIQFHLQRFSDDADKYTIKSHHSLPGLYSSAQVRNEIFGIGKWFPFSRVYRKDIVSRYPFPKRREFYEDFSTIPEIFLGNYSLVLLDCPLIAYRSNPHGTTFNHRPEHAETLFQLFFKLSNFPRSVAVSIWMVQVARTLAIFRWELDLRELDMEFVISTIKKTESKAAVLHWLRFPDAVFFIAPRMYYLAESVRQFCKKQLRTHKTVA
ncbi:MAG: glycosyltransferase family 2 protein [Bacteroidota bacterium]